VRSYIFTEWEEEKLEEWLRDGTEDQSTRDLLSKIRRGFPGLAEDMELLFRTIRAMQRRGRWWGRITARSEFGSALRRAESALTRARRGAATSSASRG